MPTAVRPAVTPAQTCGALSLTKVSLVHDSAGTLTYDGATWISFQRTDSLHASPSGPDWRSAPPNAPVIWEPEEPLIVPPNHSLQARTYKAATASSASEAGLLAGSNFACYGYITDIDTARRLGFEPTKDGVGSGTNIAGFRGTENSLSAVVTPPTGYAVQIIDVYIRQQQLAHSPTNTSLLFYGDNVADVNTIFTTCNNNPSDFAEWKFSPGIYLPANKSLFFASVDGARSSICITYRCVRADEVPKDHWWSYRALPTPGTATLGTTSLYTTATGTFTAFYPGIASDARLVAASVSTTATLPGNGKQHIVEGYAISAQKDLTTNQDHLWVGIATGTAGGSVGVTGSGLTTTNKLISPIFCLGAHNQMLAIAVDGLNIPCPKDTGLVVLDTTARGYTATPAAADLDVDEFHCLVWGRTKPAAILSTTHFQGGAA